MAKKKKATKSQATNGTGFEVVDYEETSPLPRTSKYDALIAAVEDLEIGKAVLVPVPSGVEPEVHRNRISSAINNSLSAPEGYSFRVEIQEDRAKLAVRHKERPA